MALFLQQIMAMPTVVFTALLGIVIVYWLFVVIGALDIDMIDVGADLDGLAEGATEGAMEGAAEGATEGLGGAVESAEGVAGLSDGLSLLSFMTWIGLRNAPFTVVFSLIIVAAWTLSILSMRLLTASLGAGALAASIGAVISIVVAMPIAGLLSVPLGPLFRTQTAEGRRDFIGRTCVIETGSVDERFGVGTVQEDGRWPRLEIRAASPNTLRRGSEALIIDYDPEQEVFRVEALDPPKVG
ncbi:MAG: glycine zipper family protein [Myxococcota bacterium]